MFTGIIESKIKIKNHKYKDDLLEISVSLPKNIKVKIGDSVSVSGCCLTVSRILNNVIYFQVMKETQDKTIFGKNIPNYVNIERALKLSDRLGGHIVTGHVDCVGIVQNVQIKKEQKDIVIKFPQKFSDFVLEKGSVCVEGVSLTISKKTKNTFSISLIPHTLAITTLNDLKESDCVNLEFDIVSKHIVRLIKK